MKMEFHEKLQALRKQKGLTQEELAQALYVSRTAVSKWESGRGYPNMDSLKAIARFYGVTIDALLSGEEVLNLAEEDHKQRTLRVRDLIFGLLDLSAILLLFLPLFGQQTDGSVLSVSLLSLTKVAPYMRIVYFAFVSVMALWGTLMLAMQSCFATFWIRSKTTMSCAIHAIGLLLFIVSSQPYAAALLLFLMAVKVLLLVKKP